MVGNRLRGAYVRVRVGAGIFLQAERAEPFVMGLEFELVFAGQDYEGQNVCIIPFTSTYTSTHSCTSTCSYTSTRRHGGRRGGGVGVCHLEQSIQVERSTAPTAPYSLLGVVEGPTR